MRAGKRLQAQEGIFVTHLSADTAPFLASRTAFIVPAGKKPTAIGSEASDRHSVPEEGILLALKPMLA
jgi:hypothetical protein